MKKFLTAIVAAIFLLMSHVNAEVKTYTGTGEYRMGDSDTPKSAERGAKEKALRDALERAGVYVGSYSEVEDAELVTDKITSRTGAVLKVLDTKVVWDGFIVRVTVQVEIDADELNRRLKNIDTPEKNSSPPAVDNVALSNRKVEEAVKLCDAGKFREAVPICKAAIKLNADNAKSYEVLGWAHNGNGEFAKSIEACNKALKLNPNSGVAYERLARAYIGLKKYDQAIFYCNKAIQIDQNYNWAYLRRAKSYAGLKNYRQAIDDYTKAIQLESKSAYSYWYRGKCYEALGEHDRARADFAKARQLGWKG